MDDHRQDTPQEIAIMRQANRILALLFEHLKGMSDQA
jgi:hypothetical protein